jgi:hypothetical protein
MIELIITIVLIGIIFAAIPGLLFRAVESDRSALEGEALYHAAAKIQEIISQPHNSILNEEAYRNKPYVVYYDGSAICNGATETVGIHRVKQYIPAVKRDAICIAGTAPDFRDISSSSTLPLKQSAINEYNGWKQQNFSQGYTLEVAITPVLDNHATTSALDPDWRDWPSTGLADPSDLLLITVTASYSDTGETIGVLRYAASNVGKR